jgi:hypothetical protein
VSIDAETGEKFKKMPKTAVLCERCYNTFSVEDHKQGLIKVYPYTNEI